MSSSVTSGMQLVPATEDAKELLDVGTRLGLDPIRDIDLMWIVQDFMSTPLPTDWQKIVAPNGETHYINTRLRYDVTTNPVEPRFKTLVSLIKESKVNNTPLDEVTVLELLDPIERAADVKEMAEYQGIDVRKETHLLWIAKLAVLETMPEGWEEHVDPSGRTLYRNHEQGYSTEEHPADTYFKALLERERAKRHPYISIQTKYFTQPVAHFRNDEGGRLRTLVEPASGTFMPFYDLYGQYYWFDVTSDTITMDLEEVRRVPAAVVIQRIWRGYMWRNKLWQLHAASMAIGRTWRNYEFRKAYNKVNMTRDDAAALLQKAWHVHRMEIAASQQVFVALAELGSRCRRLARVRARTGAIQANGLTYRYVRRKVIYIQRAFREHLAIKVAKMRKEGPPYNHDSYIVASATRTIQDAFRAKEAASTAAA
mmetsp:Transcript_2518/g.5030  ORF Transcript_2518/g.5030 Transcript_2518/m.5030 type:complete len:426 (+) Transcript_2518:79-1356(+)|eukprot:CAMPEP_0114228542 /NCGR_PEP_ID=MMETSP0058-20121206/2403_1 /TAXON_ID=36894 /ORGANISM="Pyramimonas parkeae, CCMP726" /LENGTH=425 /DNA_ID=CAMNT_0001339505 /DNA_START=60 /DNA_END=1337 /DNA_ORIENTATION=+